MNMQGIAVWRTVNNLAVLMAATILGGCSVFPYEEHFACEGKDAFGRCTSVDGAYKEAVSGEPQGPKIQRSRGSSSGTEDDFGAVPPEGEGLAKEGGKANGRYEGEYRKALYYKLRNMIEEPETPMVKPPHVVRTLILTYKSEARGTPLFMPRYVYFFADQPTWVLGDQDVHKVSATMPILRKNDGVQ